MRAIKLTANIEMLHLSHSADTNDDTPQPARCTMYQRCVTSRWLSVYRGSHLDLYIYIYTYISCLSILATINNAPRVVRVGTNVRRNSSTCHLPNYSEVFLLDASPCIIHVNRMLDLAKSMCDSSIFRDRNIIFIDNFFFLLEMREVKLQ